MHLRPRAIERYRLRLSGPLLDRIDLQVYVRPVPLRELRRAEPGESSAQIRARVAAARDRQLARLRPWNLRCNAEMPVSVLRATCKLDSLGERTLAELVEQRKTVTARSVDRLIKVARTVADLMSQDDIDAGCLLEAAGYRDVDPTADLACEIAQLCPAVLLVVTPKPAVAPEPGIPRGWSCGEGQASGDARRLVGSTSRHIEPSPGERPKPRLNLLAAQRSARCLSRFGRRYWCRLYQGGRAAGMATRRREGMDLPTGA